jgi:hypothetical protein
MLYARGKRRGVRFSIRRKIGLAQRNPTYPVINASVVGLRGANPTCKNPGIARETPCAYLG